MTHFGIVVGSYRVVLGYWSAVGYYEVLDGTVLKELGETNMSWMSLKWFACRSSYSTYSTTKFGCVYARCCMLHVACGQPHLQLVEHFEDQLAVHIVLRRNTQHATCNMQHAGRNEIT